jgi:hypothetical protein
MGYEAGRTNQGDRSVAIGSNAGRTTQGSEAIAVGYLAGNTGQGSSSVAIGTNAGKTTQGSYSIAIGYNSAAARQGTNCIAIGDGAGHNDQANNSIIINSSSEGVNTTTVGDIIIKSTTTDLRSLPDGGFAMSGDPIISATRLTTTLSTLRTATINETTLEGLRDSISNALAGLIEDLDSDVAAIPNLDSDGT